MTFSDQTDRAANSNLLAVASRFGGVITPALLAAALIGGFTIIRDHDRAIIEMQAQLALTKDRQERQGALIGRIFDQQSASSAATSGIVSRLDAQAMQLQRIERLVEQSRSGGAD